MEPAGFPDGFSGNPSEMSGAALLLSGRSPPHSAMRDESMNAKRPSIQIAAFFPSFIGAPCTVKPSGRNASDSPSPGSERTRFMKTFAFALYARQGFSTLSSASGSETGAGGGVAAFSCGPETKKLRSSRSSPETKTSVFVAPGVVPSMAMNAPVRYGFISVPLISSRAPGSTAPMQWHFSMHGSFAPCAGNVTAMPHCAVCGNAAAAERTAAAADRRAAPFTTRSLRPGSSTVRVCCSTP